MLFSARSELNTYSPAFEQIRVCINDIGRKRTKLYGWIGVEGEKVLLLIIVRSMYTAVHQASPVALVGCPRAYQESNSRVHRVRYPTLNMTYVLCSDVNEDAERDSIVL